MNSCYSLPLYLVCFYVLGQSPLQFLFLKFLYVYEFQASSVLSWMALCGSTLVTVKLSTVEAHMSHTAIVVHCNETFKKVVIAVRRRIFCAVL
jgi:hypothetical protein